MSRESVLILLGALVALSPFSGLPISWLAWILPVFGAVIAIIGMSYKTQKILATAPATHDEASTE